MGPLALRRVPVLVLVAVCLAALPFLRDDLGHRAAFLPACLGALIACDLVTAVLLARRFRARGSVPLLGLAAAYLAAGVLATAQGLALPGVVRAHGLLGAGGDHAAGWLWAVGHVGLPLGLALALWGGPAALRRRLSAPTTDRGRATAGVLVLVAAAAVAVAGALLALGSALPALTRDGRLSGLGQIAGPLVLAADLGALVLVARRGRRSDLERRLLVVVACAVAGTALTLAAPADDTVGWYAAHLLDLLAAAVVLVTVLADLGRAAPAGAADRRAGASDALTGVRTRAATLVAAEHLHRTRRPGTSLGLAVVDVDGLRAITDAHGPLAADAVLLTVARRLHEQLRDEDVLGRAGDEGFLVVLPGTNADGVTLAIDRAIAAIRDQPVGTWAHDVRTTASGGIAMVGRGPDAVTAALAEADHALVRAKAGGRDQVVSPARGQVLPLRRAGAGPPRG